MKVAIAGYGLEGQESARYWSNLGHKVTICDKNSDVKPENSEFELKLGEDYLKGLGEFDIIVRTAGLHPKFIIENNSPAIAEKITSSVNEFLEKCPSKNIIGVTGTKGKGTTSTLITKFLEASGKTVHLGGNIGIPALELLPNVKPDDWVVLELSSFQLIDIKHGPKTAVCLMVVPEHLDWHKDLEEYTSAKSNLFKHQNSDGVAIFNSNSPLSEKIVSVSPAHKRPYDVPPSSTDLARNSSYAHAEHNMIKYGQIEVCPVEEVKLLGRHNLENICAGINAVWDFIDGDNSVIKKVVGTFGGLEHRIEFVREVNGVKYYNDSFATTPETSIACMRSFPGISKVMILGGSDKGIPFDSLADEVVRQNVKHAVLIGDTAEVIATLLQDRGYVNITLGKSNMIDIVNTARELAEPGDVVLLSTGCASFGLFKDYKDRGNQFKQSVNNL